MSETGGRRREGGYLFVRKGARRVSIDEVLPGRQAAVPKVSELLAPGEGLGGLRGLRPRLRAADLDPRLCFFLHPDAPICDVYRQAVDSLLGETPDARRLLVTSPRRRAGRTLTAVNLASALAEREHVVLCDLQRRAPGVARAFGLSDPAGLADAHRRRRLRPGSAVDVTLVADRLSILCIEPDAPADALDIARLRPVLDAMGAGADRVVIDGPAVLDGGDILDLAVLADGIVLIVEPADLGSGDYEQAIERLDGRPIAGVLINDRGIERGATGR